MSDYVSHEPPCGWLKLQSLFIQKSAYLITHVDWDDETVKFESLAQIVDYGKRALRECLERKHEADSLKVQRDELLKSLELMFDFIEEPPAKNCRCHANPPCSDCVDYGFIRETLADARNAIAKAKGEL